MSNYLCIDYGRAYVGLAYATTSLAEPLETVKIDAAPQKINQLINNFHITHLVVGLSEGLMGERTQNFVKSLNLTLPVIYHDETLSSYDTRVKLAQSGTKKSRREAKTDHFVAAAILQDYLDSLI